MAPMRTIGIVGGLSWEATALYYRLLNEGAASALGPGHNARSVIWTVEFPKVLALAEADRWDGVTEILADAARRLQAAGADMVLLAANTAHLVAEAVAAEITVPLLHIADAVGEAARARGFRRLGLLGTRFTLEAPIFPERLAQRFGLECLIPAAETRRDLHGIITGELTQGRIEPASRQRCLAMIDALRSEGAEAVVLACTELPLLLRQQDSAAPLLDSTALHVEMALRQALAP